MTYTVTKGQVPISSSQLERNHQAYISSIWPQHKRERSIRLADGVFDAFIAGFSPIANENEASNTFNAQLAAYRTAVARLERVDLAVGRPETKVGTGIFEPDETGEMVEVMQTLPAIEPLVAEDVEYPVYDDETGEQTDTVIEPDRDVVATLEQDAAERAAAQAVIDGTPQEVKDFAGG